MDINMTMNLVAVAAFVAIIVFLVYTKKTTQAKQVVLALVVQAENIFGGGTGTMKYAYVSGFVYPKLPSIVRLFVSQQTLDKWIEDAVNLLKTQLQANPTISATSETAQASQPEDTTRG